MIYMPNQITSSSLRLMIIYMIRGWGTLLVTCVIISSSVFFFLNHFSKFSSTTRTHTCAWLSLYLYIIILCCSMRMHKAIILWWLRFPSSISWLNWLWVQKQIYRRFGSLAFFFSLSATHSQHIYYY